MEGNLYMKTKLEAVLAYARPWGQSFLPIVGSEVISEPFTAKHTLGLLLQAKRHKLPVIRRRK